MTTLQLRSLNSLLFTNEAGFINCSNNVNVECYKILNMNQN